MSMECSKHKLLISMLHYTYSVSVWRLGWGCYVQFFYAPKYDKLQFSLPCL